MAYYDQAWYVNAGDQATTGYYAVAKRASGVAVVAGQLVRQFTAPAVNSERVFICIIAGTTAVATDATWVTTRGAKTTDGTATWMEVTGMSAVNGDKTNTWTWAQAKAFGNPSLGAIIQRNNGASYWICTTAGGLGASEPAWANDTAGTTQADSTVTWTCIGPVTNFTTGGAAPHARLANACAATWLQSSGNFVYVGDNHAESQSAIMSFFAGNSSLITKILCHNHSGSYPPAPSDITTGATISTTTNSPQMTITCFSTYVYGITFKAQVGATSGSGAGIILSGSAGASQAWGYFDNCSFQIANTSGSGVYLSFGVSVLTFNNCAVSFANINSVLSLISGIFRWQNTGPILASGSIVPIVLLDYKNATSGTAMLEAIDLSQITTTIFNDQTVTLAPIGTLLIKDCKLPILPVFANPELTGMTVQLVRSSN